MRKKRQLGADVAQSVFVTYLLQDTPGAIKVSIPPLTISNALGEKGLHHPCARLQLKNFGGERSLLQTHGAPQRLEGSKHGSMISNEGQLFEPFHPVGPQTFTIIIWEILKTKRGLESMLPATGLVMTDRSLPRVAIQPRIIRT